MGNPIRRRPGRGQDRRPARRALWAALCGAVALQLPSLAAAVASDRAAPLASDARWGEADRLERQARALDRDDPGEAGRRHLEAARLYEAIAREAGDQVTPWWKSARSRFRAGDALPSGAKRERTEHFAAAEALSDRGLALDADCAECMLWKFASMGRLRTTRFGVGSLREVSEMAALLDRGIALDPQTHEEGEASTLAALHYSSAIFYRVMPDWAVVGWMLGVRGNKERALSHIRTASSIHPGRLDYRLELGSQLLCLGESRDDPARLAEGQSVLREAIAQEPGSQEEVRHVAAARIMLEEPDRACSYSGDGWVEFDEETAVGG